MSDNTPIEKAAQAFDAVIGSDANRVVRKSVPRETEGPAETLFKNVGDLDPDTEPEGGGDNIDPEGAIYEEDSSEADPRDTRKGKGKDSEDDDASDGDGDDFDPGTADDADDESADDDESGDAEPKEEEEAFLKRKVEVTVDGEAIEVPIKEALEGYVRTKTFHQRMNQLDEAKKVVRRAAADAVQNYEYSMNLAKEMEAHMDTMIPKEPDWDAEFTKDPAKARDLQRYYEKANEFRKLLRGQMAEISKKQQESNANQLAAFAEEEGQKFDQANRKNWSDPKKKVKDLTSMRKTALSAGFTEEEVSSVYDSRMLQILLKASKFDRMMAARPKPLIRPSAKPVPSGAGSAKQRAANKGVSSAMKRLNRTGRIEDAAVVFDQIIAKG